MRRLTFIAISRRRSPSTFSSRSMISRTRAVSSSVHALTRLLPSMLAFLRMLIAVGLPIP